MSGLLADLRDVARGAGYMLAAVTALALTVLISDAVVRSLLRHWRDHWLSPQRFTPCGILDSTGRPCFLPDDHPEREHATEWVESVDRDDIAVRHRFDDTAMEGRYERRFIPGRGGLPLVTRTGTRVPTP